LFVARLVTFKDLGLRSRSHILIDAPNTGVGLSSHLVKLLARACTRLVLVLIVKVLDTCDSRASRRFLIFYSKSHVYATYKVRVHLLSSNKTLFYTFNQNIAT